jgi:phosphatidylglycerophosphatase A
VIVTLVGVWAATEVVRKTGLKDPQIVCIDEVAGVLITLVAAPNNWKGIWPAWCCFAFSISGSRGPRARRRICVKAGAW